MNHNVNLIWDEEACVWYSSCDSVPLTLESESLDELIKRVTIAAPELLELNHLPTDATLYFVLNHKMSVA